MLNGIKGESTEHRSNQFQSAIQLLLDKNADVVSCNWIWDRFSRGVRDIFWVEIVEFKSQKRKMDWGIQEFYVWNEI